MVGMGEMGGVLGEEVAVRQPRKPFDSPRRRLNHGTLSRKPFALSKRPSQANGRVPPVSIIAIHVFTVYFNLFRMIVINMKT